LAADDAAGLLTHASSLPAALDAIAMQRPVASEIRDAQLLQLARLVVVCQALWNRGKGVGFAIEALRSADKLEYLCSEPESSEFTPIALAMSSLARERPRV
jgi:hypothetical protein